MLGQAYKFLRVGSFFVLIWMFFENLVEDLVFWPFYYDFGSSLQTSSSQTKVCRSFPDELINIFVLNASIGFDEF
jgi:hypothetical protein